MSLPATLIAGDTLQFKRQLPDYLPSDSWQLKYSLVGTAGAYSFDASADGDGWLITVASDATASWAAGRYTLTEYVTKSSTRTTLASRTVVVSQDLAGASAGLDTRTHARKVLDAIEAWLESRAPTTGEFQVAGRRLQNYPITDLLSLRDKYRAEVAREEAAQSGRRIGRLLTRI